MSKTEPVLVLAELWVYCERPKTDDMVQIKA